MKWISSTDVRLQDDSNGQRSLHQGMEFRYCKTYSRTIRCLMNHEAQTYENNEKIKATRKALYGAWDKQLEEIYDHGIDSWKARIAQIKTDNPKETE
jgi:hypothetical protein